MDLNSLKAPEGSRKSQKRIGRGPGSGTGVTAGKGHKGQKSRSGYKTKAWFEGGQMPLQRRIPKFGFTNIFRKEYQIINLSRLSLFKKTRKADIEAFLKKGLIKKKNIPVKILGNGEIDFALEISAHKFSKTATEKITNAGGKVTIL
ncbi:50S ribosomal protein L15 [candidate division KSB1 bacterium]